MSLHSVEQGAIVMVFLRADKQVAAEVRSGVLHPGTALAVLATFRDVVRPLDPQLADILVARATEDAATTVAAEGEVARMREAGPSGRWRPAAAEEAERPIVNIQHPTSNE